MKDNCWSKNEKKILLLCGSGHFCSHFYMLMFPSLALWVHKDFGLSLADTLNLGFLMYLLFGLMALPMGVLGDRLGNRNMLILMHLGTGISALFCGLSTGPGGLMAGLALVGFFASVYHPVGLGMLSRCCKSRGRALGLNGVCGSLGIGLAPFSGGVVASFWGWRSSFIAFGAMTILIGSAMIRVRIDEQPVSASDYGNDGQASTSDNGLYFILMLCCMMLLGLCYRGTVVSLPAYFETHILGFQGLLKYQSDIPFGGAQIMRTSLLVSGVYFLGMFGQLLGGRLADVMDLRMAYLAFHIGSLPFVAMMALLTELPLFAVSLAYVFLSLGQQPIENSLVARLTPNHFRSLAYGLKFILVFGIGAFAVKLVRWLMAQGQSEAVYVIQAGLIVVVIGIVSVIVVLSRGQSFRNA